MSARRQYRAVGDCASLRAVTRWTGSYADGRTGQPMSRAEAQRTCRAAMQAGLVAEAVEDRDVLRVQVLR